MKKSKSSAPNKLFQTAIRGDRSSLETLLSSLLISPEKVSPKQTNSPNTNDKNSSKISTSSTSSSKKEVEPPLLHKSFPYHFESGPDKLVEKKEWALKELNQRDKGGWSLLHYVSYRGFDKCVSCLLNYGVDINTKALKPISRPVIKAFESSPFSSFSLSQLEVCNEGEQFETVKCTLGSSTLHRKWYYEVVLLTDGRIHIGWSSQYCPFSYDEGSGVGSTAWSFGYDGYRKKAINCGISKNYGRRWKCGDVVGCLLDTLRREVQFFLNGKDLGVAFEDVDELIVHDLYPASSITTLQRVQFVFDKNQLKYPPQGDYGCFTSQEITQPSMDGWSSSDNSLLNACTPLHCASLRGHVSIVKILLNSGADPNLTDESKNTPLMLAASQGHTEVCQLLLNKSQEAVNNRNSDGTTPLLEASRHGSTECIKLLLSNGASFDKLNPLAVGPLFLACRYSHIKAANLLLSAGSSPSQKRSNGITPLHEALAVGAEECVKVLLLNKIDPNQATQRRFDTPLHYCGLINPSSETHLRCAQHLLREGAHPDPLNAMGYSPFLLAIQRNCVKVAKTLLLYGAKPNTTTVELKGPGHLAAEYGSLDSLKYLSKIGIDLTKLDAYAHPPIYYSTANGYTPCLSFLLENTDSFLSPSRDNIASPKQSSMILTSSSQSNQSPNSPHNLSTSGGGGGGLVVRDQISESLLHTAARGGHLRCIQLLIEKGADVNGLNERKQTPLHLCLYGGHTECVLYLIEEGGDLMIRDCKDRKALSFAPEEKREMLIDYQKIHSKLLEQLKVKPKESGGAETPSTSPPPLRKELNEIKKCSRSSVKFEKFKKDGSESQSNITFKTISSADLPARNRSSTGNWNTFEPNSQHTLQRSPHLSPRAPSTEEEEEEEEETSLEDIANRLRIPRINEPSELTLEIEYNERNPLHLQSWLIERTLTKYQQKITQICLKEFPYFEESWLVHLMDLINHHSSISSLTFILTFNPFKRKIYDQSILTQLMNLLPLHILNTTFDGCLTKTGLLNLCWSLRNLPPERIKQSKNLMISLPNNGFSVEELKPFLEIIPNLRHVGLMGNKVYNDGVSALCKTLLASPYVSLQSLDLRWNGLKYKSGEKLSKILTVPNICLNTLKVGRNHLHDHGAKELFVALLSEHCHLTSLDVSSNWVTNECLSHICKAVETNSLLTHLDISHNRLTSSAGWFLRSSLTKNKTLTNLELNANRAFLSSPSTNDIQAIQNILEANIQKNKLEKPNLKGLIQSAELPQGVWNGPNTKPQNASSDCITNTSVTIVKTNTPKNQLSSKKKEDMGTRGLSDPLLISRVESSPASSNMYNRPEEVLKWSERDVRSWLGEVGYTQYQELFFSNDINGKILLQLTEEHLRQLPITSLGHRLGLKKLIQELKDKSSQPNFAFSSNISKSSSMGNSDSSGNYPISFSKSGELPVSSSDEPSQLNKSYSSPNSSKPPLPPPVPPPSSLSFDNEHDSTSTSSTLRTDQSDSATAISISLGDSSTSQSVVKYREIDYNELVFEPKPIGTGDFAVVFKGTWRGAPVAIKQFLYMNDFLIDDLKTEAGIMHLLGNHPNVVRLVGAVTVPPHYCLVTDYYSRGSVYDSLIKPYVERRKRNKDSKETSEQDLPLPDVEWSLIVRIARDAAAGILHLHYDNVIHRDLACRNLLLDDNYVVHVSDLGLSRVKKPGGSAKTASTVGPVQWMAPEAILERRYSEQSDVYSFGVVLWELVCRDVPYADMELVNVAMGVAQNRLHLPIPDDCDDVFRNLMLDCWQFEPELRPDFDTILSILQSYYMQLLLSPLTSSLKSLPKL